MKHELARRGLLALPAAAILPTALLPGTAAAAENFVQMRTKFARLKLGANLERWFPVARDNRPRRLGRGWWRDFRAAGFDHARLFLPEVGKTGSGMEIPGMFAEAVQDALAAGVPVFLGMADFFYQKKPWEARDWAALQARAEFFVPRCDPANVVLAALNEPIFDDSATWLPMRDRLLGIMRRAAPHHLLMWGGHEWCSARSLVQCSLPADPGTIAEAHDYQGGDAAALGARFRAVAEWRDRNRLPVVFAELGGAMGHETNRQAWAADLALSLPILRELGLPATLWSYSHGGWWRLQAGDDPSPRGDVIPPGFLANR
ncbi:MAG: hypothetical protein JWP04_3067 [Belnapia sp.]|jgi:hypothetical protein|nr:hypothetical protein [Belnapia sp.]